MVDEVKKTINLDALKSKKYDAFKTKFELMDDEKKSIFLKDADKNRDGKVRKHEMKEAASAFMVKEGQRMQAEIVKDIELKKQQALEPPPKSKEEIDKEWQAQVEACKKEDAAIAEKLKKEAPVAPPEEQVSVMQKPVFKPKYSKAEQGSIDENKIYTVKDKDSLYKIVKEQLPDADAKEINAAIDKLHKDNLEKGLVGEDKGRIFAGQKLDLSSIVKKDEAAGAKDGKKEEKPAAAEAKFKPETKIKDGVKTFTEPDPVTGKPLREIKYDVSGKEEKIQSSTTFDPETGKPLSKTNYENGKVNEVTTYDPKTGNKKEELSYWEDGRTLSYKNVYDPSTGNALKTFDYEEDGKTLTYIKTYDPKTGKSKELLHFLDDGKTPDYRMIYDADGNAVKRLDYKEDGKTVDKTVLIDEKGDVIDGKPKAYTDDKGIKTVYESSTKTGKKIKETVLNTDGKVSVIKLYDENTGKISSETTYGKDGRTAVKTTSFKDGKPIKEVGEDNIEGGQEVKYTKTFSLESGKELKVVNTRKEDDTLYLVEEYDPKTGKYKKDTYYKEDGKTIELIKDFDADGNFIKCTEFEEGVKTVRENTAGPDSKYGDINKFNKKTVTNADGTVTKYTYSPRFKQWVEDK